MAVLTTLVASSLLLGAGEFSAVEKQANAIAKGFGGRLGYHVRLLDGSGVSFGYRDKERYPSASTIKTVVMIEAFRQIERGEMSWGETLEIPPAERRSGLWVGHLKDGKSVNIDGLVHLMMGVSDNTATVMLSDRVGVEKIEKLMLEWGLTDTACTINVPASNQRLTRLRTSFANMGVTSPDEMATILEKIYRGTAASPAACEKMLRIMTNQYWDDFIGWQVPPTVAVASKVGALNRSRSDSAIVMGSKPYILTVYTDNQADREWTDENEGNKAIRRISEEVWNGLNPDRPYRAPEGSERWYPTGAGVGGSGE